jgi:hypothetical protein
MDGLAMLSTGFLFLLFFNLFSETGKTTASVNLPLNEAFGWRRLR